MSALNILPCLVNQPQLQPNPTQNFNFNAININNIFQQSSLLLPNSGAPIKPEEPKKIPEPSAQVNEQESQKLNSFLNSLGFKIGGPTPEANPPQPGVLQPLELIARAKDGIYLVNDQEKDYVNDKSKLICESAIASIFSRDGTMLAVKFHSSKKMSNQTVIVRQPTTLGRLLIQRKEENDF